MKAFLNRLGRSRDRETRPTIDREKPQERIEKPSPSLLPALPPAFKADDFFSDPSSVVPRPATPPSASTQHQISRLSPTKSNNSANTHASATRPLSQLEISLQKPLPEIRRQQPLASIDEGRKPREASQATAVTSTTSTAVSSRPSRDPDSQGRSTFSKQSQSTHITSIGTESSSGSAGVYGAQAQGGSKKVAFISPPPTPAGLSVSGTLPDLVTDLNTDSDGQPSPNPHQPFQSLSKTLSFPNGQAASASASTAGSSATSLTSKDATPTGRSSTNLPPKISTANSPKTSSATGPRAATSPASTARTFGAATGAAVSQPRAQSRAEFSQSAVSLRSGTPYSRAPSTIQPPSSWSEAAEEDLVSNIGPRERTRQEVLWEIVASEQRFVQDLIKLKETFIDPLLHPYATAPPAFSSPTPADDHYLFRSTSPNESSEHLPIASRFLASPTPGQTPRENVAGVGAVGSIGYTRQRTASEGAALKKQADAQSIGSVDDEEQDEKADRMGRSPYMGGLKGALKDRMSGMSGKGVSAGRSPYGAGQNGKGSTTKPFPSRSHNSLPPPSRTENAAREGAQTSMSVRTSNERKLSSGSTTAVGSTPASRMFGTRKLQKQPPIAEGRISPTLYEGLQGLTVPPHMLPEDLRICLEVLENSLKGHMTLCEGLRKRYDEQYPLVRSLADVFVTNSHILEGYATYVLHLERALEQVDNALLTPETTKRPKNQDAADWAKVCRLFKRLEEIAVDKGETGLAISLSKPFQRLLKYPLMFQNLLFHTDPSTFEYEATLQMVAEVEKIVRSIEDEKIQKEERDRTRDVFARIDGLEKVKMLAVPKPSRLLMEEKPITGSGLDGTALAPTLSNTSATRLAPPVKNVKNKSSLKRLSDVLPGGSGGGKGGVGGKNDLWLVRFNDVVLRCQRVGTTNLPLATGISPGGTGSRSNSTPDFNKGKYATTGRRYSQMKPRNLYKYIKIETWVIGNVAKPRAGMVSMEDISRSRTGLVAIEPVKSGDTDDEGNSSDDSDRKSKMSFSYWGADKITVDPVAAAKARASASKSSPGRSLAPGAYTRPESVAKAKFGNRLRHSEADDDTLRSSSTRKTAAAARRAAAATDDSVTTSAGARKPAWNSRTSGVASPSSVSSTGRRLHNQSTTSNASALASRQKVSSLTPTEDSGIDWIDPSIARF